jgi:hypothetical protein
VHLSEHLKALERVLGTWELSDEGEKGEKLTMRWVSFKPQRVGRSSRVLVRSGARSASSIFYYDLEPRKVVCVVVPQAGHIIKTFYAAEILEKESYSALSYFTMPDWKQGTLIEHIRWIGKDQLETDIFVEGEKSLTSETIMHRVK